MRFTPHILRSGVLAAIMLAMLSLPFAHRSDARTQTAEFAAFVAMGGTIADICSGTDGHIGGSGCDACRIVNAMLVPPRVALLLPALDKRAICLVGAAQPGPASAARQGRPPARAPPSV